MCAHKVCKIHLCIRLSGKHRSALVESDDRLSREKIKGYKAATVLIGCKCIVVELSIYVIHIYIHAKQL